MDTARTFPILVADDDDDDRQFMLEAMAASRLRNPLYFVKDGLELLEFLRQTGEHADAPRPGLILVDLNMPRLSGREAIEQIKADADLRSIPLVVLTTSRAEDDIVRTYEVGASSYIVKPVTFDSLVEVMQGLGRYWFEVVELPPTDTLH